MSMRVEVLSKYLSTHLYAFQEYQATVATVISVASAVGVADALDTSRIYSGRTLKG